MSANLMLFSDVLKNYSKIFNCPQKMIITLLSDYGIKDNFVAIAKGILLQKNPQANIIDISHEVKPHHLLQCSYLLGGSYLHFPENTIHIVLFGIMKQCPSDIIITHVNNQFIVTSDNGLLPFCFENNIIVKKLNLPAKRYIEWMYNLSRFISENYIKTFESFLDLEEVRLLEQPMKLKPIIKDNSIECQVIHIDRYGNIVLNITKREFEMIRNNRSFYVDVIKSQTLHTISNGYWDVGNGEMLLRFNSADYLELAVNGGNAAALFGLDIFDTKSIIYKNVKINF